MFGLFFLSCALFAVSTFLQGCGGSVDSSLFVSSNMTNATTSLRTTPTTTTTTTSTFDVNTVAFGTFGSSLYSLALRANPLPGNISFVSAGLPWIWGLDGSGNIFRCLLPCTAGWTPVEGALKQLDVSDTEVWGVNSNGAIFQRPIDGSGAWAQVPANSIGRAAKWVSLGSRTVWALDTQSNIYRCYKPCTGGSFVKVDGALSQLDVGDTEVWGVNSQGDIFKQSADSTTGAWAPVPCGFPLKQVSVGTSFIWGIDTNNAVYKCKRPCNGLWWNVSGVSLQSIDGIWATKATQCAADFGSTAGSPVCCNQTGIVAAADTSKICPYSVLSKCKGFIQGVQWGSCFPNSISGPQVCGQPATPKDLGFTDSFQGWYDTTGCGYCVDYCRWVGDASVGDPAVQTVSGSGGSWWACALAGSNLEYTPKGAFGTTFNFKRCSGQNASSFTARPYAAVQTFDSCGTADWTASDPVLPTSAGMWFVDGNYGTGVCNIGNTQGVAGCQRICASISGCNFFSTSTTMDCYACFVWKTCPNMKTVNRGFYQLYQWTTTTTTTITVSTSATITLTTISTTTSSTIVSR
jgi:hypothetical protein